MPRVSVLLALYNAGRFLEPAVRSVLEQTYRDFEFLIVDDGSTDGSREWLRTLTDPRVRLIEQQNAGQTVALNRAARESTGEYLARMDADDVCKPDRFAKQVAFLDAHPEVGVLGGAYEIIDHEGRLLRVQDQPADDAELQRRCLVGLVPICHPLVMMRRDIFERVGGFDETQYPAAEDLDLWLRMGEHAELACLPDVLLSYRMHAGSMSEAKGAVQADAMQRACEAAWQRRGVEGQYEFQNAAGWRPTANADSRLKYALQYGWWAWNSGERRTAFHYGWSATKIAPLRRDGWNLMASSILKRGRGK